MSDGAASATQFGSDATAVELYFKDRGRRLAIAAPAKRKYTHFVLLDYPIQVVKLENGSETVKHMTCLECSGAKMAKQFLGFTRKHQRKGMVMPARPITPGARRALRAVIPPRLSMSNHENIENPSNTHVKCDRCGWREDVAWSNVPNWHQKPCPQCGEGEIVSNQELQLWRRYNSLIKVNDAVLKLLRALGRKPKTCTVRVDTAPTRTGGPVSVRQRQDKSAPR
jgi:ferredoxin-like protein FixX/ribosomal protein S27AE